MRLRMIEYQTPEDRQKLKIKPDDVVIYEGVKYVVKEAGLRYLRVAPLTSPNSIHVVKTSDVIKTMPEDKSRVINPNMNFNP